MGQDDDAETPLQKTTGEGSKANSVGKGKGKNAGGRSGFRVQGSGFRVQGLGFRVLGFRV